MIHKRSTALERSVKIFYLGGSNRLNGAATSPQEVKKWVSVNEVMNIRLYSWKTNKLRNVYTIGRGASNNFIKKWQIYYLTLKLSRL